MKQMHLEDALEDNPRTRNLLKIIESDASFVRDYSLALQHHLGRTLAAHSELCDAMGFLSQHLKSYQEFGSYRKSDSILPESLLQFALKVDDLSSMHQILISQIADGLIPLKKFIFQDVGELFTLKEIFNASRNELDRALCNHLKFSKKKEKEKMARELEDEVFVARKKFHEAALKYYSSLNGIQMKKMMCMVEPLLNLMKAHITHYDLSSELMRKLNSEDFIGSMDALAQSASDEIALDKIRSVEEVEGLEKGSVAKYFVEPPGWEEKSFTNIMQKAGYLMLRSKSGLLTSRWDQYYFFIQGGCIMYQGCDEMAGRSLADLDIETTVEVADVDDRRFAFNINQPSIKKHITLQADSYHSRDEWMAVISNASREAASLPRSPPALKDLNINSTPTSYQQKAQSYSTPACDGGSFMNAPIQFDIITPCQEHKPITDATDEQVNPFDNEGKLRKSDGSYVGIVGNVAVSFVGSQQFDADGGDVLLKETMRQILAARAFHNVFKMSEFNLVVSDHSLVLIDPQVNIIKSEFILEDISYWGVHDDNKRLFGFISRSRMGGNIDVPPVFTCHIFDCAAGDQICKSLTQATQKAYEALLKNKVENVLSKETELLLENINKSDEATAENPDQHSTT